MRRPLAVTVVMFGLVVASCGSDAASSGGSSATVETLAVETPPPVTGAAETPAPDTAAPDTDGEPEFQPDELFPDILEAVATESNGAWKFDVTVSSPYDSPQRYADGFRILSPDGTELGFRLLTHDHASEQPFTRSLDDVVIPDDISSVTIEGRDQVSGFGGNTVDIALPGR